ncbi:glycoside hydrolase family 43 protein [Myriangium duriaei CBS 260.36]|uniref:Glycoside hydrolase family 43 protein n=1 Tax=Myriangium duriaei CBS 260.36 TaxID=1168546 RepID=A0A9P4MKA9_9PEZI|nr:glycoside hydrolase family 43 protein [Myriangium duriaei CBS 260.36]
MLTTILFSSFCSLGLVATAPVDIMSRQATSGISTDFPDPSVLYDGNTWYVFASQSEYDNKNIHIQLAQSTDFNTWTLQQGYDALPQLPSWAVDNGAVWAPDINKLADGSYLLYFSAATAQDSTKHCVGTARSKSVRGPFTPDQNPFDCDIAQGGSIDASGFVDSDGTRYVTWKIDANSLGHGGVCNNGVAPIVTTPILIQQVQADGATKIGSASTLIVNDPADGPLVEAPSMIKHGNTYILYFSSNCFSTPQYDESYAYSSSPTGGFAKAPRPLFVTGDQGLTGPGGGDVTRDGTKMVLHTLQSDGRRFLHTTGLNYQQSGSTVTVTG